MSNNGGHLTVQYNLRWSEELRDKIAEEAKKNTRSMNQEIIARLEESFAHKLGDNNSLDRKIYASGFALGAALYQLNSYEYLLSEVNKKILESYSSELIEQKNKFEFAIAEFKKFTSTMESMLERLKSEKTSLDASKNLRSNSDKDN